MTGTRKLLVKATLVASMGGFALTRPPTAAASAVACETQCVSSCEEADIHMCDACPGSTFTCTLGSNLPVEYGGSGLCTQQYAAYCAWAC